MISATYKTGQTSTSLALVGLVALSLSRSPAAGASDRAAETSARFAQTIAGCGLILCGPITRVHHRGRNKALRARVFDQSTRQTLAVFGKLFAADAEGGERLAAEQRALEAISLQLDDSPFAIRVPKLIHANADHRVILMRDEGGPPHTRPLSSWLPQMTPHKVAELHERLGRWLARVHQTVPVAGDLRNPALQGEVSRLTQQTASLLRGEHKLPESVAWPVADRRLAVTIETIGESFLTSPTSFVIGDLSQTQVLVAPGRALVVHDFEYAGLGRAGSDLGRYAARLRLLGMLVPDLNEVTAIATEALFGGYASEAQRKRVTGVNSLVPDASFSYAASLLDVGLRTYRHSGATLLDASWFEEMAQEVAFALANRPAIFRALEPSG